jgi:hypothetical protein
MGLGIASRRHHASRPRPRSRPCRSTPSWPRPATPPSAPATPAPPSRRRGRAQLLGQILGRDPHYRDAIGLTRALATQLPEPAPAINLLSTVFGRITDPACATSSACSSASRPRATSTPSPTSPSPPRPAPTASRRCAAWSAATSSSAARTSRRSAMEQLLALYDPGEPSAIDLRLILAGILAQRPRDPRPRPRATPASSCRPAATTPRAPA